MARTLYTIKGTLYTSTSNTEKTHGDINDDVRAVEGVVTLNTRSLDKDRSAIVVKVDPNPFGGKFTQEVHDGIIAEIEDIVGVRKFKVHESPFIKPEPKVAPNPVPQAPTSYDRNPQISPKQR